MTLSKVISEGSAEARVSRWEPPAVDGPGPHDKRDARKRQGGPATAGELEGIQKQAYDEGFEEGHKAGLEAGHQEGYKAGEQEARNRAQEIGRIANQLSNALKQMDEEVESQLVELAFIMAKQIIRREIQTQPGEVLPVVREALAMLPLSARDVRVHVHPDDAKFLNEVLGASQEERAWKVLEDMTVSRGGCRVTTAASRIDASLERRLTALASQVLGDDREPAEDEGEEP